MKKGIIIGLLLCLLYVNSNVDVFADSSDAVFNRHVAGFEKVLKGVETDPYYKYGIYSSRIIAVKHPEVYLQGDMIFAKYITSQPGFLKAYSEPVNSIFLDGYKSKANIPPFSFGLVNFDQYSIVSKEQIYSSGMSVFGFLDERISPIQLTLKVKTITSLEGANLIYIKKRIEGSLENHLFLILTKNATGYIYDNGKFYSALGAEVEQTAIKDPVLIFNEHSVWYPLMQRDDTEKDSDLNQLVKEIATSDNLPLLSTLEKKLADGLKKVSELRTPIEKDLAAVDSINFVSFNRYDMITNKWLATALPDILNVRAFLFLNVLTMKTGDFLSPRTAYYAEMIADNRLESLQEYQKIYFDQVATIKEWMKGRMRQSAWAHTWACPLIENNIDDMYRTRGGHCISQATNTSAVLDLAGVENIYVNLWFTTSHSVVILPQYKKIFDNGYLVDAENYISEGNRAFIEVAMRQDSLIILEDDLIYANLSKKAGYSFHREINDMAGKILKSKTVATFKENSDFLDMMRYKTFMIP